MKAALKKLPFVIFLLSPTIVVASGCGDYTSDGQQICETYYTCKWESNACTERCPTNNNGQCVHLTGCFLASSDDGGMGGQVTLCQPCLDTEYNDGTFQTCQLCSTALSAPKIFDSANATYGQSECPWMCDNGYYRGGANDDTCIQCTGNLTCSGTGLEYSNTYNPTGISCSSNYRLVPDDTTHTYSCQSCTDSHATLNGNNCVCNVGYYGTPNGVNTQCTACPAGTTTGTAGATTKSACHMTPNTKFCDAKGNNCMKLLSGANNIN
ncbi:MAG: hypothetical protein ACLRFM_01635 [Alphaproteobacteria bacterium]